MDFDEILFFVDLFLSLCCECMRNNTIYLDECHNLTEWSLWDAFIIFILNERMFMTRMVSLFRTNCGNDSSLHFVGEIEKASKGELHVLRTTRRLLLHSWWALERDKEKTEAEQRLNVAKSCFVNKIMFTNCCGWNQLEPHGAVVHNQWSLLFYRVLCSCRKCSV